jgi:hypothetical protein
MNTKQPEKKAAPIEGEGSYEATHRYDAGLATSIREGKTEQLAKDAEKALEGPEGKALRDAEEAAKLGPKHKPTKG